MVAEAQKAEDEAQEKRLRSLEVDLRIVKSRRINDFRMAKMKARFELVEQVKEATKGALLKQRDNALAYKQLLQDLIQQGLIKLLEGNVEIKCCKRDQPLVASILKDCEAKFGSECKLPAALVLDDKRPLPDSEIGGVILTSMKGRIVCNNSLKARLDHAYQMLLPEMRHKLFGR